MKSFSLLLGVVASASAADKWDPFREGLDAWRALDLDVNFAINVGTVENGREFTYSSDKSWTLNSVIFGASFSKWTTSVMIGGLVKDGILSFDDKANKHLSYWATDPKDVRSEVTLESLLSLTSGFQEDSPFIGECLDGEYVVIIFLVVD